MPLLFEQNKVKLGKMIKEIKHYPQLDTVLLIEKKIKETKEPMTKTDLYKKLGGKVMYPTLIVVLVYLIDSGKIIMDNKNKIVWIYNPEGIKKFKEKAEKEGLILK